MQSENIGLTSFPLNRYGDDEEKDKVDDKEAQKAESNDDKYENADVDDAVHGNGTMDAERNIHRDKEAEVEDDVDDNSSNGDGYYGSAANVSCKVIDLTGDISCAVSDSTVAGNGVVTSTDSSSFPSPSKCDGAKFSNHILRQEHRRKRVLKDHICALHPMAPVPNQKVT